MVPGLFGLDGPVLRADQMEEDRLDAQRVQAVHYQADRHCTARPALVPLVATVLFREPQEQTVHHNHLKNLRFRGILGNDDVNDEKRCSARVLYHVLKIGGGPRRNAIHGSGCGSDVISSVAKLNPRASIRLGTADSSLLPHMRPLDQRGVTPLPLMKPLRRCTRNCPSRGNQNRLER